MQQYIRSVIQLCLLKGSPEALPYSRVGLGVLIAFHFLLRWGALSLLPNADKHNMFEIALLWVGATTGLVFLLLFFKGVKERWLKVMMALFSIELFFLVFLKAILVLMVILPIQSIASLLIDAALIWVLLVKAHIFKLGLSTKFFVGILCALMIEMLSNLPVSMVLLEALDNMKP